MPRKPAENLTVEQVMEELKNLGDENTARIYKNRGMNVDVYGVRVADLKKILKRTKKNHELSLALYDTNNYDAMYLAGLMADETKITKEQLQKWIEHSDNYLIAEFTVPWLVSETPYAIELAIEWIESEDELIRSGGWNIFVNLMRIKEDDELDFELLLKHLKRVIDTIHTEKNRVRYSMNTYVIGLGTFVEPLLEHAKKAAAAIGKVDVSMGNTACNVPLASAYIEKVVEKGYVGKKRKQARC